MTSVDAEPRTEGDAAVPDAPQSADPPAMPDADALDRRFAAAAEALDRAGVRWCRLRERGAGLEDDLLIAPADLRTAVRALAAHGWLAVRHLGHGSHRWMHAYDGNADRWLRLDVVSRLDHGRWQEWPSGLADGALARADLREGGRKLAPDDAFWTLLLHETLDRPGTEPRRLARLQELSTLATPDGPAARIVETALPRGRSASDVLALARAGDGAALRDLGSAMSRGLGRRPAVRVRRLVARVLRWLDHRDPPFVRRGRTVALLGPDGAGKSSLAGRIGGGGPLPRQSVYLGLYGGGRGGRRGRRIPGLGFARRLLAMWRGWLVGWWAVRRGRLVIFDRHPYDARLEGSGGFGSRIRRALLGHALPAPDAVVVLDAPAALLYARKPEHPLDRIEAQRHRYLALAARLDRAVVVDASAPIEVVARQISSVVWDGARPAGEPR
ncbi:MAG TPA: hypothetical protein VFI69_04015 [Candidatus Limnocylindrales bacterium]|nr:hypothetical protein [Candidatus Limnocylindrales bacterium]